MLPVTVHYLKNGRNSYETASYSSKHKTLLENNFGKFPDYRGICLYYRPKRDRKRRCYKFFHDSWKPVFYRLNLPCRFLYDPASDLMLYPKKNPKINIALTMYLINTCVLLFGLLSYGILSVLTGIGFTALQSLTLNCFLKKKG